MTRHRGAADSQAKITNVMERRDNFAEHVLSGRARRDKVGDGGKPEGCGARGTLENQKIFRHRNGARVCHN